MNDAPSVTDALVAFAIACASSPAPAPAMRRARDAIAESVACMLAGSVSDGARISQALPGRTAPGAQATVAGTALRAGPVEAAFLNALAAHALDYDDMNATFFGHPSCTLVPAVLACSEIRAVSGPDLIGAYVVGLEIDARLGRIANPQHYQRGWHSTSTLGIFGATAAAGRVLGLTAAQLRHALGIAASQAGGVRANFGTMTKALHAGRAAGDAVQAALLARAGYTASPRALDGPSGFLASFGAATMTPEDIAAAFDPHAELEIVGAGIGYKPYACCGCATAAIDALLELRRRHALPASEVASIECRIHPLARNVMTYEAVEDELQAKYSIPYCLAVAMVDGRVGIGQFTAARRNDAQVMNMLQRVTVVGDPTVALADGNFAGHVIVTTRSGRQHDRRVDVPRGDPRNPLDPAAVQAKFVECAEAAGLGAERIGALRTRLDALGHAQDAGDLARALATPSPSLRP
jgi:2-methylcitrate dehydratase PrpD